MSVTITVNDERLKQRLQQLVDAAYGQGRSADVPTIIEDETRLLLKQIIAFTPPKTQKQGEQAIQADLERLFTPANRGFLVDLMGGFGGAVDRWFTNKQGQKVHVQFDAMDVDGTEMERYHEANRTARGRVPRNLRPGKKDGENWVARYVVSYEAFAAYLRKVWQEVGMLKAGWIKAYSELGGKLPNWIARHASKDLGGVVNNLGVPSRPSITVSNHAAGVGQLEHFVRQAIKVRANSIARKIKLLASGYAADVRSGGAIRKHAERSAE